MGKTKWTHQGVCVCVCVENNNNFGKRGYKYERELESADKWVEMVEMLYSCTDFSKKWRKGGKRKRQQNRTYYVEQARLKLRDQHTSVS